MKMGIAGSLAVLAGLATGSWAVEEQNPGPNREEFRKKLLDEFDGNSDGILDEAERARAKQAMAERRAAAAANGVEAKGPPAAGQDPPRGRPTREQIIAKFDEDNDGKLNAAEREKARAAFHERRQQRGGQVAGQGAGQGAGQAGGQGQPPQLTEEQRKKLIEKFDKNGDGQLTGEERARARDFLRKRRQQQGAGQGGAGQGGNPQGLGAPGKGGPGQGGPGQGGKPFGFGGPGQGGPGKFGGKSAKGPNFGPGQGPGSGKAGGLGGGKPGKVN